jgi:hypothetical protein
VRLRKWSRWLRISIVSRTILSASLYMLVSNGIRTKLNYSVAHVGWGQSINIENYTQHGWSNPKKTGKVNNIQPMRQKGRYACPQHVSCLPRPYNRESRRKLLTAAWLDPETVTSAWSEPGQGLAPETISRTEAWCRASSGRAAKAEAAVTLSGRATRWQVL